MKGLVLSYIIAYGGAVTALFQPIVGVIVYAILSTARPQVIFGWAGDLHGLSQIVGVATLIGWAVHGFGDWRLQRARGSVLLLAAFLGWVCVSALFAANQAVAWAYVIERLKIVLIFLVGITTINSAIWIRRLAWALVLSQAYIGFEMNLSYVQGYNRAAQEGFLGDNNSFAISMVAGVGPAIFLGFATREWWKKAVAFGSAALILHTVLLTFSRGGILALIITGITVFIVMPKRPSLILALAAAALLTFRLMGPEVTARFMTSFAAPEDRDASAESRVQLWQDCRELMRRHPVTGIGPGHFPLVAPDFGWPPGKSAHSLWMQMGAEIGLPGTVCLLGLYVSAMLRGLWLSRRYKGTAVGVHGLYVFSGLTGFIFSAQFVSIEGLELPYFIVMVAAATLKLLPESEVATEAAVTLTRPDALPGVVRPS